MTTHTFIYNCVCIALIYQLDWFSVQSGEGSRFRLVSMWRYTNIYFIILQKSGGFWLVSVWIYAYKKLEIWDWERRDLEPAAWKANAGQPEGSCWTHGTTAFLERGASVGLTRNMESRRGSRIHRRSPKTRWRRGEGARSAIVGVRSGAGAPLLLGAAR